MFTIDECVCVSVPYSVFMEKFDRYLLRVRERGQKMCVENLGVF